MTRPQAQAEALITALSDQGAAVIAVPGLEILPNEENGLDTTFMDLDRFQHVIFTSINAARIGMERLDSFWPQWPIGIDWYAIGAGTARVMREFQIHALVPEKTNSEGLLALPGLQHLAEQKVLVVKGEGGRPLLPDTLAKRGATLMQADVYRRRQPKVSANKQAQVAKAMTAKQPLIMLVSSLESLDNLKCLLAPNWAALQQRPLLVVSERIAQHAQKIGFQKVSVSPKPDDTSVINALEALLEHRQGRL